MPPRSIDTASPAPVAGLMAAQDRDRYGTAPASPIQPFSGVRS